MTEFKRSKLKLTKHKGGVTSLSYNRTVIAVVGLNGGIQIKNGGSWIKSDAILKEVNACECSRG